MRPNRTSTKPTENLRGVNFFPALFTLFVVMTILKVTNTIDWSWWIVTLPLYLWVFPLGFAIIFFIFGYFLIGLARVIELIEKDRRRNRA